MVEIRDEYWRKQRMRFRVGRKPYPVIPGFGSKLGLEKKDAVAYPGSGIHCISLNPPVHECRL
jgi:hypothetical protein